MLDAKEYYQHILDTTETPGWKLIVEDAEKNIYNMQAEALEAPSFDKVNELRGEARQLAYVVNLQDFATGMLEQLDVEEDEDADL